MMPIKIEPRENTNILEMNEKELLDGYYEAEMYHFMPEYLEKVYKGPNAKHLKDANKMLEIFKEKRNEFEYIGSHVSKDGTNTYNVEYYTDGAKIYVYLIDSPKNTKYYPSLQMVCVYERNEKSVVN